MREQTEGESPRRGGARGIVELERACPRRHGAKAGNLAWVIAAGFPVPRGFVLEDVTESTPDGAFHGAEFDFLETLDEKVIVRSSAQGEDSGLASYAGQLESIVCTNVREEVGRAVERCLASHATARSSAYGAKLDANLGGLSILIQDFRTSHASGVLFTRSPLSPNSLRIEYCAGHSGDLVGGRISPLAAELARSDLTIHSIQDGGSGLLPAERLEELARIGMRLEELAGHAVDVEWCYDESRGFEVVQVRPITVAPVGAPQAGEMLHFSRSNIGENYPEAVCPLLHSVARESYYHYFRELGGAFGLKERELSAAEPHLRNVVGSQAGCLYYNLGSIYACFGFAPAGATLQDYWNTFLSVREAEAEPARARTERKRPTNATKAIGGSFHRRFAAVTGLARLATHGIHALSKLDRKLVAFERSVERFHVDALRAASQSELAKALSTFRYIRTRAWLPASLSDAAAMFGIGFLKALLGRAAQDDPSLFASLVEAGGGLESAKPVLELAELEALLGESPEWKSRFLTGDAASTLDALSRARDDSEIPRRFFGYLERWGYRSAGELLLTRPTLLDEPVRLVGLLRERLVAAGECGSTPPSPSLVGRRPPVDRITGLPRELKSRLGLFRSFAVAGARRLTRWGVNRRERARLKQAQLYHGLRKVALGIGGLLTREGVVSRPEDAYFLTLEELEALVGGSFHLVGTVGSVVRVRRAELEVLGRRKAPQTLRLGYGEWLRSFDSAEMASADSAHEGNKPSFLRGLAASPGRTRGRVSVVRSLDDIDAFLPGTILVARYTDPGWTPYFARATGLILEHGGLLCHGAIVAREFGIPTVTEASGALDILVDGMEVTLDGNAGWVRIES